MNIIFYDKAEKVTWEMQLFTITDLIELNWDMLNFVAA